MCNSVVAVERPLVDGSWEEPVDIPIGNSSQYIFDVEVSRATGADGLDILTSRSDMG